MPEEPVGYERGPKTRPFNAEARTSAGLDSARFPGEELSDGDTTEPKTALQRWFRSGGPLAHADGKARTYPWYMVVWLTGVDYFSSLAYQPGLALLAAGFLSPTATLFLVLVTLAGALPVYREVAQRSYAGLGSIAILENLLTGWTAKLMVLALIGFATTDFVITMTLSAADAAEHAVANPFLHPYLAHSHLSLTLGLLTLLAIVFLIGFREAILLATMVAVPYVLLNVIILIAGLWHIFLHPQALENWRSALSAYPNWTALFIASALVFPRLALGLSGFETGVSVMPLTSGGPENSSRETGKAPLGRIRNTKKMLAFAAFLMGTLLIGTSFVSTLLIPARAYRPGGDAVGRAPAYLAHHLLGAVFGSVFDVSTIAILWFAGASAMAGLINLIPRYLPRFGMAPSWVAYRRPMVLVLFAVDVLVTLIFDADVDKQGGAYATGVLVLIFSAAVAVTISLRRESRGRAEPRAIVKEAYFGIITLVFAYTLIANVFERPDGVYISAAFVFMVLVLGGFSRYLRSRELRVSEVILDDPVSARLWDVVAAKRVNLVPVQGADRVDRARKSEKILSCYKVRGPLAFLHVSLLDNRSEFMAPLRVSIEQDEDDFIIRARGAVAIANTVASLSELLQPQSLFLELTRQNLMSQAFRYLFLGEGETGLMVYSILVRHWEAMKSAAGPHPVIFLVSM
jgi:hypothetical protein